MKHLLVILFVAFNVGYAQSSDTINLTDAGGLKQGWWQIKAGDKKPMPTNYTADKLYEEGKYKDSKKTGVWITYFPNGKVKSEITFTNGSAKGYAKVYYEDGKVQEEGTWENGRWTGDYKMYHPNGQLSYEFKYNVSGKREGTQTYYYDNGQVMMKGDMKNGKEVATWTGFYENGEKKDEKVFNDGVIDNTKSKSFVSKNFVADTTPDPVKGAPPVQKIDPTKVQDPTKTKKDPPFNGTGCAKLYNMNKQIEADGCFKNYKLQDGKDYIYSKDGILVQIAVYKAGNYAGDSPIEDEGKK